MSFFFNKKNLTDLFFVYLIAEVEYIVRVFTGDKRFAGTDANVFVNLYGVKGDTGERQLKDSDTNMNKYERNQVRHWSGLKVNQCCHN